MVIRRQKAINMPRVGQAKEKQAPAKVKDASAHKNRVTDSEDKLVRESTWSLNSEKVPNTKDGLPKAAAGRTMGAHQFRDFALDKPWPKGLEQEVKPGLAKLRAHPNATRFFGKRSADFDSTKQIVVKELGMHKGAGGLSVHDKLMGDKRIPLNDSARERVLDILTEAKSSFVAQEKPGDTYQDVNWQHTCGEIDQVIEASLLAKLDAKDFENALIGSIFSDSMKSPANFITHNVDGASAAAVALERYFDDDKRIFSITQSVLEHQIGPPKFMAMITSTLLRKHHGAGHQKEIDSIAKKIASPFEHRESSGRQIEFSEQERSLLAEIGVDAWYTPSEKTPWHDASRAIIDGDSLINYATPEGFAKIAAIRGPDTAPFFEDATLFESLESAKESFHDAMGVVSAKAQPLGQAQLKETETIIDDLRKHLRDYAELRTGSGRDIPFLDKALTYPGDVDLFSESQHNDFAFAKELRDEAVAFLRAQ